MTQVVSDTTRKCSHTTRSRGSTGPGVPSARGTRGLVISTMAPRARAPSTVRDHATCPKDTPSRATFMNRKLAPHTTPIARNCTQVDRRPLRFGADAATACFEVVLVLTGRA